MHEITVSVVAFARAHGVAVRDPVVLRNRSNLVLHLAPAPVVARIPAVTAFVRARPELALARETAVSAFLGRRGVPVTGPSPEIPPGPHSIGSWWVNFARHVPHDGHPDAATARGALSALHDELRGCELDLPVLVPALDDLAEAIDALELIGQADLAASTRAEHESLRRAMPASVDHQVLHGDAHPRNLLFTRDGLVWNDFEDTCRGPREWDEVVMGSDALNPTSEWCRRARELQARVWPVLLDRLAPPHPR